MDREWRDKIGNLNLIEQWKTLYDIKIKLNLEGLWGKGDGKKNSESILRELPNILKEYKIKTFTDCGCGNFFWLHKLDWIGYEYLGIDIVNDAIEKNKKMYPNFKFKCMNIVDEVIPKSDLVFLRSVFIHLRNDEILKAIKNIKKSGSRYMMASNSPELAKNGDTECLMLVRRNLLLEPFNLPEPLLTITERPGIFLSLWDLEKVR